MELKTAFDKEQASLEEAGCKEVQRHNNVYNYYYVFLKGKKKHFLEHVLNVYGESCNIWEIDDKTFDNFDEALKYIKSI